MLDEREALLTGSSTHREAGPPSTETHPAQKTLFHKQFIHHQETHICAQCPPYFLRAHPLPASHGSNPSISQPAFGIASFAPSACTHGRLGTASLRRQTCEIGSSAFLGISEIHMGGWAETQVRFAFSRHGRYARLSHTVLLTFPVVCWGVGGMAAEPTELWIEVPACFLAHRARSQTQGSFPSIQAGDGFLPMWQNSTCSRLSLLQAPPHLPPPHLLVLWWLVVDPVILTLLCCLGALGKGRGPIGGSLK